MSTPTENTTTSIQPSAVSNDNDLPPLVTDRPPRVLIAGAGLGGLFLGILLDKAGIPYEIFERSAELRHLGSVMCLSPNILPAVEQVGLYEELMTVAKPVLRNTFYTGELGVVAKLETLTTDTALLLKKIPPKNLRMSKKVLSFEQDQDGVTVTFDDNSTARGDILVGADGAHSAVRQHLYKSLGKQHIIAKVDNKPLSKGYISLVGTTGALDPVKYPCVLKEESEVHYVIGDNDTPYSWFIFSVPGNKICWTVIVQLGVAELADENFSCSDWVPQKNNKMMDSIRHLKIPFGTMGDLFDATPDEAVSKVLFEDQLFDTWNHGRTVLIGDAAHQLLPASGSGAINAMQDAVILANHIYDIKPTSYKNIKAALSDYKDERFGLVEEQYGHSRISAKLLFGHTFWERIFRYVIFNWLPASVQKKQLIRDSAYRPQAVFLPPAPKRGTMDVTPQRPSKRVQQEVEEQESKKRAAAAAAL
ncbi:hypothetical protein BGZ97_004960 [Linnemannia gamsii]|uniref:FAD-binding domain-containing protein n=1 Tax=Linnemannia gamsii TaxID=64522 RepID=A0A9P6QT12_9FUNG|nr:hypothetical protein BGZ97_004960 [Linnemannia gamsii]